MSEKNIQNQPMGKKKLSWKNAKSLGEVCELIDYGVILSSSEIKGVQKNLTTEDQSQAIKYLAQKFCAQLTNRYAVEVTLETALIWMSSHNNEQFVRIFLETLFDQRNWRESVWTFVDIALALNPSDENVDKTLYSFSVAILCEIGLSIHSTMIDPEFKGPYQPYEALLEHIAAFLLSVSNSNDPSIRLSLFQYFGKTEKSLVDKKSFNRIMFRFGQTVVDYVINMILSKKNEGVVLQYIIENFPIMVEGDTNCQRILHESFKSHMLKFPERFCLFFNTLLDHFMSATPLVSSQGIDHLLQHVASLLQIASEVNHRELGRDLVCIFARFPNNDEKRKIFEALVQEDFLRKTFRDLLMIVKFKTPEEIKNNPLLFKNSKRGRKPSLSKPHEVASLTQVLQMGVEDLRQAG